MSMLRIKTVALHNLGCKVNGYESEKVLQELSEEGFRIVPFSERADVYIINTCTVTNIADRKSRQMIRRARRLSKDAIVVAIGCYVDTKDEGTLRDLGVDYAFPNKEKGRVVKALLKVLRSAQDDTEGSTQEDAEGRAQEIITQGLPEDARSAAKTAEHTRAYLKIQDGCNLFCSYCIIPYARGRSESVPMDKVLREAKEIAASGKKEIVLTGIHISSYHDAQAKSVRTLIDLVEALQEIEGIKRIRLGSLEPRLINELSVKRLAACTKVCPHFHLSLQSGCDATLRRMERRYTTADYRAAVFSLRAAFENPALTTDVITGFPGETEADFEESRRFIDEIDFYETHVFPYSVREGTKAAGFDGRISLREKTRRSDILLRLTMEKAKRFRASMIGQTQDVLFEKEETINGKSFLVGHTARYVRVGVPSSPGATDAVSKGAIVPVRLAGFLNEDTLAGCR